MSFHHRRHAINAKYNTFLNLTGSAFQPSDHGWLGWSYDPLYAYTGAAPTAGYPYFTLLPIRQAATVTNVLLDVVTAGSSLTSGQCFAGLFNSAGTLLSVTADQSTNWQSTGLKVMPLAVPQPLPAGIYYVGYLWNGTTGPQFSYNAAANAGNGANSGTYPRFGLDFIHGALTTAFHSPATVSANYGAYWAGVS